MRLRASVRLPPFLHGTVARDFAVVGGAIALGQSAVVLAAPLLARLYDPAAFGLLSVYLAMLSVLVATASLRYDFAIPIAADRGEAVHLVVISVILVCVTSLLLVLAILMWGPQLVALLGAPGLATYLWLLPIALLVAGATQALGSWAVFERSFGALARMRAVQSVGQTACQAALGLLTAGPLGLIAGDLVGRAIGTQQLLRSVYRSLRLTPLSFVSIRQQFKTSWGFARVMTVASLLSALSLQLPFLLIPVLFDLDSSGQYFLAYRVLVLPASLVGAAIGQVFLGQAAFRKADALGLHDLALNTAVALLVFAIPTYGIVIVVGPALFAALFGDQWMLAGQYAQIIAPSLMLWSVASPISTLLIVGRRERESLAFTAAGLTLEAAAIVTGDALGSLTAGIIALSITSVLLTVVSLRRFLRVAAVGLSELVRPASRIVACCVPSLVTLIVVGAGSSEGLLVASALGWAVALAVAARVSPELHALLGTAR